VLAADHRLAKFPRDLCRRRGADRGRKVDFKPSAKLVKVHLRPVVWRACIEERQISHRDAEDFDQTSAAGASASLIMLIVDQPLKVFPDLVPGVPHQV
jgi:hypothetical protein